MRSVPDLMRKLAPRLLANGASRGKPAPGWAELRLLLEHWDEIAGSAYAALTTPHTIKFLGAGNGPSGGQDRRNGTLIIAAPGALRLELQHDAAIIIDRVNRLFGFGAITRLQLIPNSTLVESAPQPTRQVEPALLAPIENEGIRTALAGLGAWLPVKNDAQ